MSIWRNSLLFVFVQLCGLVHGVTAATAHPPRIGVIVPLSGPVAWVGEAVKNAVLLAQSKHTQGADFQFLFEDSQFIAKTSLTAAKKLVELDGAKALIVFGSTPAPAVAPFAEQNAIPVLNICVAEDFLKSKKYIFRIMPKTEVFNQQVVAEVLRRQYKSVAIITAYQDGMLALRDALVKSEPTRVVFSEEVLPDDRDLRSIATKIAAARPDAVYLLLLPPQISIFSRQLRESGFQGDLFGGPPLMVKDEREAAGKALHNAWFVSFDDSRAQGFYQDYDKLHASIPPPEAMYGYDAAMLFMRGWPSGDVARYLKTVKDFEGIAGKFSAEDYNTFSLKAALKVITQDGVGAL